MITKSLRIGDLIVCNVSIWYPILDRFRTKYYEVIVNLVKELEMTQKYLTPVQLF